KQSRNAKALAPLRVIRYLRGRRSSAARVSPVFAIMPGVEAGAASHTSEYAERLIRLQTPRWKRWLGFQRLHAWNLHRLAPGLTLDLGCGIGRNLLHVRGVGVDVNAHCVDAARARGLDAFTPKQFEASEHHQPGRFDT